MGLIRNFELIILTRQAINKEVLNYGMQKQRRKNY